MQSCAAVFLGEGAKGLVDQKDPRNKGLPRVSCTTHTSFAPVQNGFCSQGAENLLGALLTTCESFQMWAVSQVRGFPTQVRFDRPAKILGFLR